MDSKEIREALAEYAHGQWSGWMEYLFSKCSIKNNGTAIMPKWAVERWMRQIDTKYIDLSESEKDSERKEADGMIKAALSIIDPEAIRREARDEALREAKEEIRQAGETAIEVGYEGAYIRGLDKALALVSAILSAEPAQDECPDCIGRGWIVETDRHDMPVQVQCETCLGRGYIGTEPAEEEWKEKVERRPEHCEGCSRNNSPVIMSICGGCYRLFRKDLFSPSATILGTEPVQDDGCEVHIFRGPATEAERMANIERKSRALEPTQDDGKAEGKNDAR